MTDLDRRDLARIPAIFDDSADIPAVVAKLVAIGVPGSSISVSDGRALSVKAPPGLRDKVLSILDTAGGLAGSEQDDLPGDMPRA